MSAATALRTKWRKVTIGTVCSKPQYGWTTSAANSGDIKLLRTTDITHGPVDWSTVPYCRDVPPDVDKYLLADGDIVVSRAGSVGVSCRVRAPERAVFASYLIRFRPKDDVDGRYLAYILQSPDYWAQVRGSTAGIAVPNVNASKLEAFDFPLAPLLEQRRIVAQIEEQFTRLEAGVSALRRAQVNLKRYRTAVFKAACEGKLVPTESELQKSAGKGQKGFESGEQLLKRILAERRQHWTNRGRYKEPVEPDTTNLPPLPEGWTWASLDQLLVYLRNGWSLEPDAESGTPILRISAVRPMSVNLEDVRYLKGSVGAYSDYVVTEGDLLFTRYNGNPNLTGVCGVVPPLTQEVIHPDKLIRVRLVPELCLPQFVGMVANVGASREFLASRSRTTAGQTGISGSDLRAVPVLLPPRAEQTRIVAEVERRLSVVEELESVLSANLQRAIRLRQSTLQQAFSGRLATPSDAGRL